MHSIYEIPGARDVAIELRSLSKTAGFTGTRCAYMVIPKELKAPRRRRPAGAAAPAVEPPPHDQVQRRQLPDPEGGRGGVLCPRAKPPSRPTSPTTWTTRASSAKAWPRLGYQVYGGVNAPYIWLKVPGGLTSWDFFDKLLAQAHVVGTPGSGFGSCGEGYFRLSAFGFRENVEEAIARISSRLPAAR